MLRLGAIGLGQVFAQYASAIRKLNGVTLYAVADTDTERCRAAGQLHCAEAVEPMQLLEMDLDGVLILTPNRYHYMYVRAALLRDIPALCEKPLVTSVPLAYDLLALEEQSNSFLYTAMHYRHRPEVTFLRQVLRGHVVEFTQLHFEDWRHAPSWYYQPEISGGGVLLDVGINCVDWILPWVPGLEVAGADFKFGDTRVETECDIAWSYNNGVGYTSLNWHADAERRVTTLVSDMGDVLYVDHLAHTATVNGKNFGPWINQEYVHVIREFMGYISSPQQHRKSDVARSLSLLRQAYASANVEFLSGS